MANLYDTYKESNAASNAELERNFPTPPPTPAPTGPPNPRSNSLLFGKDYEPQRVVRTGAPTPEMVATVKGRNTLLFGGVPNAAPAPAAPQPDLSPEGLANFQRLMLKSMEAKGEGQLVTAQGTPLGMAGNGMSQAEFQAKALADNEAAGAKSEALRLKEVAAVDARGAFATDKAAQDKVDLLRSRLVDKAQAPVIGMTGLDKYNMSFVGKADASNPSYRNAVIEQQAFGQNLTERQQQRSNGVAALSAQVNGLAGRQSVGGQAYNAAGDLNQANVRKLLSDANLNQATAASGGKGTHAGTAKASDAVKDIVDLAGKDPVAVADATGQRANILAGGTPTYRSIVNEKGKPEMHVGIATAETLARMDRDTADLQAAQQEHDSSWNYFGRGSKLAAKQKTYRDRMYAAGMRPATPVATK